MKCIVLTFWYMYNQLKVKYYNRNYFKNPEKIKITLKVKNYNRN